MAHCPDGKQEQTQRPVEKSNAAPGDSEGPLRPPPSAELEPLDFTDEEIISLDPEHFLPLLKPDEWRRLCEARERREEEDRRAAVLRRARPLSEEDVARLAATCRERPWLAAELVRQLVAHEDVRHVLLDALAEDIGAIIGDVLAARGGAS